MLSFTGSTARSVACGSPTRFVACAARGEGSMLAPREEKDRYDADNRPLPGHSAKNRPLAIDFDRRRSIEQEKEKKRRKRSKKEKRKRIPIARAQSSPMHRRRSHAVAARGSRALFLPREEKDRGDKQKEEGKKEYLASAVLARLPSPPAHDRRPRVAHGRFFSRARRQIEATNKKKRGRKNTSPAPSSPACRRRPRVACAPSPPAHDRRPWVAHDRFFSRARRQIEATVARQGTSASIKSQEVRFNEEPPGHSPEPKRQALRTSARLI
ncbi:hypothetical protein BHM03_00005513 [Ensete ventricosum]|uniref:Uncharacterized protein n=1 Tax=Ensete ventricosum TaxID=4639 RepID=A0A445MB65_ENSVE|nr:hypothetical protein BHM03_00005513 [Ensete ventricosum]